MIAKELLSILVCPVDHTPLRIASDSLLARLNRAIEAGNLKNQAGCILERPLHGGLVRADGALLYPVLDDIPVLLSDEAVPLDQIGGTEV